MSRPALGLDIDGVVCAIHPHFNAWVKQHKGHESAPLTGWDWYLRYPNGQALWDEAWGPSSDFVLTAPAVAGAVAGVLSLSPDWDIKFITYRPVTVANRTRKWLDSLGLFFPVYYTDNKATVRCDMYLDDHGPTIKRLLALGRNAFLFKQPWNEEHWTDVPTVGTWSEFASVATVRAAKRAA